MKSRDQQPGACKNTLAAEVFLQKERGRGRGRRGKGEGGREGEKGGGGRRERVCGYRDGIEGEGRVMPCM